MSYRAHKDPCGVVGCPQFICMDASKDLRASNAALKAENEALKKSRDIYSNGFDKERIRRDEWADKCAALTASLAEQAALIDKMRIIFNNRIDKGDCQNCLAGVDAVPSPDGNWSYWYHRGVGDGVLCSNSEWRSFLYVLALPAPQPSPAPVESKPKKCSGCGCLETAPHFSDCSGEVEYE